MQMQKDEVLIMKIVGFKIFGKFRGKGHTTYLETVYDADRIERYKSERVYRCWEGDYIIGDNDMVPVYA